MILKYIEMFQMQSMIQLLKPFVTMLEKVREFANFTIFYLQLLEPDWGIDSVKRHLRAAVKVSKADNK